MWQQTKRRRRRTPLSAATHVVLVAASGVSGAATVGAATGLPLVDRLLRGGLAATAAAAAATAPTWVIVVLATGAAALGWTAGTLGAAGGAAALLLALVLILTEDVDRAVVKSAAAALSATALLRAPGGRLGLTALCAAVLLGLTVTTGLREGRRVWRKRARLAGAGLVGLTAVGGVLGGLAGYTARASFERSSTATERALAAARSGNAPEAAANARSAAHNLREARTSLEAGWARPAWAVPIVGAHLRAADEIARSAGPAVEAAAGSAEVLRLDVLRPEAGRLDLGRLAAAEPALSRLSGALHVAQRGSSRARSPWLIAPLQTRLDDYDKQLAAVSAASDRALLAVQALPRLLGGEHPTRWFVAVGNPAETRELGGCVCEYAVVTADRGAIRLERAGSVAEIGANLEGRTLEGVDLPRQLVEQHPERYWQNLGGYPDLPTVATAARALWSQLAPEAPIDGVIYVDPVGLAALLTLTGPVTAPAPLNRMTADNTAQLLLVDQYAQAPMSGERKDALHEAVAAIFTALAEAPLPGPGSIGASLTPAVRGGHLLITTFDAQGQQLFDELGLSNRLPSSDGGDLASLRTGNLGPNKLDAHLRRSVRYQVKVNPTRHRVSATATIELRNEATADLPDYVVSNDMGLPRGTDALAVAWYSGLGLESMEVNGQPVKTTSFQERGWWRHAANVNVTVPPGGATTVVLHLGGKLAATRPYRLSVAPQATVYDDLYDVEVTGGPGWFAPAGPAPAPGRRSDLVVPLQRR